MTSVARVFASKARVRTVDRARLLSRIPKRLGTSERARIAIALTHLTSNTNPYKGK